MEIEYKVLKITTVHKECRNCGGTGYQKVKVAGYMMNHKCTACTQGVTTAFISTEVPLLEALKELGLIK